MEEPQNIIKVNGPLNQLLPGLSQESDQSDLTTSNKHYDKRKSQS